MEISVVVSCVDADLFWVGCETKSSRWRILGSQQNRELYWLHVQKEEIRDRQRCD